MITPNIDTIKMRKFCVDSKFLDGLPIVQEVFPGLKKRDFSLDVLVPILQKLREAAENKAQ